MEYKKVKLREIADLKNGYAFKSKDYIEKSENLLCRMGNIKVGGVFDLNYNPKYLPAEFTNKYSNFILKDGDLIIAMTDLANDPKILGVPTIVETKGNNVFLNQRVGKLEILDDNVFIPYLRRALSDSKVRKYYSKFAGGGLQINIGKKEILDVEIPLPPMDIQIKIANALDKAQELIDNRKTQIDKYDELLQSVFLDMFGDPVSNPKRWEVASFKKMAKIDTKMTKEFEKYNDLPHIGIANIQSISGKLINYKLVKEEKLESGKYLFHENHIIFSKIRPNLNKVAIPNFKGLCSADSYPILVDKSITNRIFYTYILRSQSFLDYILKHSVRTNIPKANKKQLEGFESYCPPLQLQNQFAEIVEKVESEKKKLEESLIELENNFNSIMQRAFRGKLF